jgi:hypothetical protein
MADHLDDPVGVPDGRADVVGKLLCNEIHVPECAPALHHSSFV